MEGEAALMDQRTSKDLLEEHERETRGKHGWASRIPGGMKTLVIGGAIIAVALLVWLIEPAPPARNPNFVGANQALPVGVSKVVSGDVDITLNALGTVTPLATVVVKPQVGGQLIKINFIEGQTVKSGQVLAEIDPKPYQAQLDLAQGQLARDQAQLANARVDLTRYRTLIEQNSIAQQQVDTQAALVRQLEGTIKSDQANVEQAQINLDYTKVKSPITGRIGLRQVDLGNLLTAGQTTGVATVTQLEPISVLFTVPEDNIGDIMGRVREGAMLKVQAYDRAQEKMIAEGDLGTVDNQIDTTTGTVKLRGMFDNSANELFPNQFVNIRLFVTTLHNQVIVPVAAIQRGASGTFVYVVKDDHTVSMRTVALGQNEDDKQAVTKGLMVDETVVTDGADRLRDGARVVLPGETPPSAAQGGAARDGAARGGRGQGRGGRRGGGQGGAPAGAQGGAQGGQQRGGGGGNGG
jgi:membrane fusion protein, multidrug efflux system